MTARLLSCISLLGEILYPWSSMKYLYHIILAMESYTPTGSPSVEIFTLIYIFVEKLDTAPLPRDIMAHVCTQRLSCTAYEVSTHHITTERSPTFKVSFSFLVPLRYFNTRLSFNQSYSSGFYTHVMRNSTTICMSWSALALMSISCATFWWKVYSCYSGRYWLSISMCTLKR